MPTEVLIDGRSDDGAHRLPCPVGIVGQTAPIGLSESNSERTGLLDRIPSPGPTVTVVRADFRRGIDHVVLASLYGVRETRIMRFTITCLAHRFSRCVL